MPGPRPPIGPTTLAARHPARALDIVGLGGQEGVERGDQLGGLVLVVTRQQGEVRPLARDADAPAVADGRADPAALLVPDDDGGAVRARLVAGAVGGAVVDDDRLEPPVGGQLVEDAADLAGLVEGRDDHGDDRSRSGRVRRLGHLRSLACRCQRTTR